MIQILFGPRKSDNNGDFSILIDPDKVPSSGWILRQTGGTFKTGVNFNEASPLTLCAKYSKFSLLNTTPININLFTTIAFKKGATDCNNPDDPKVKETMDVIGVDETNLKESYFNTAPEDEAKSYSKVSFVIASIGNAKESDIKDHLMNL